MVLAQFLIHQHILDKCEYTVGKILIVWHTTFEGTFPQDSGTKNHRIQAVTNDADHRRHK